MAGSMNAFTKALYEMPNCQLWVVLAVNVVFAPTLFRIVELAPPLWAESAIDTSARV